MNYSIPRLFFVYNRLNKLSKKGTAPIELRVTYNRKQKYLGTGISITPKQWKNGHIINTPEASLLNQELDKFILSVRQAILNMEKQGDINIFMIPQELERMRNGGISFLEFCNKRASVRKYNKSKDSQDRYNRFIRLFTVYGEIKSFNDITDESILNYDKYLEAKGMKSNSKWHNYHRFLNSFINDAVNAGFLKRNPYKWISIDKGNNSNSIQKCLTLEEFQKIKYAKLSTESLQKVRDTFVFQTYTCLSYADLKDFNMDNLIEVKGMKVYIGKRDKTGKQFTIPMLKTALDILYKYSGKLPIISNVKYNAYLKVVAQAAGIDKPLTTHWARHTGATLLLNEGVPMQIVSKICGHSSTKITEQVYAKLLDETVVDAIKGLKI